MKSDIVIDIKASRLSLYLAMLFSVKTLFIKNVSESFNFSLYSHYATQVIKSRERDQIAAQAFRWV